MASSATGVRGHTASHEVYGERAERSLGREYAKLEESSKKFDEGFFATEGNEKPLRNRYTNIQPYASTVVGRGPNYINANWVFDRQKGLIATQGCLSNANPDAFKHTTPAFLQMAQSTNAAAIVVVANETEQNRAKFESYWSDVEPKHFEELQVTSANPKMLYVPSEDKREFIVQRDLTISGPSKIHTVALFHLKNWPDHGTVAPETLAELVKHVDEYMQSHPGQSLITHCSAGVGRTGVFLAVYHEYQKLKAKLESGKEIVFSTRYIEEAVQTLRSPEKGRHPGMVQSEEQYILAQRALYLLVSELHAEKKAERAANVNPFDALGEVEA